MTVRAAYIAAFAVVIVGWFVFAGLFLFRKTPPRDKAVRRERVSYVGIVIQALGYTAIWILERPRFSPIVPLPGALAYLPPALAAALSIGGVWMSMTALRSLGKEWSLEARLIEGHQLVTEGPYRLVRHPIYSAMLGKLIATGIVVSHWIGLLAGVALFSIGTAIRVRSEEKLLRAQFGAEYEAYARRVPGIVPIRFGG